MDKSIGIGLCWESKTLKSKSIFLINELIIHTLKELGVRRLTNINVFLIITTPCGDRQGMAFKANLNTFLSHGPFYETNG